MQFKYFKADWNTTIEEAKRQYHQLVLKHHPDRGGKEEDMKAVNAEWDYLKNHNFNIHESKSGSVYTDERQDVADEVTERFADIISALIRLEGIGIEICGSFVWVSGETYQWKDELKELGFRWSRKRQMWYLAPFKKRKWATDMTMDEIRARHGSLVVATAHEYENAPLLTAQTA